MDELERKLHFQISLISFDPNDLIPPHDHPEMSGVMMCVGGALHIQSFEIQSEHEPKYFLKRLNDTFLPLKAVSTLTSQRANIHRVEAAGRSQAIDIFTPTYDDWRRAHTRWYDIDPQPVKRDSSIYVAYAR